MSQNKFELPKERLATTDETGRRVYIYQADFHGAWKKFKNYFQGILLVVFLILPWIKINGHQSILLDIPGRRFAIFGLTFWAHELPILVFVLGLLGFGLAFVTAIWGRVWCGHACPQTVFTEYVYRRIERWIEGPARDRKALDDGPMTLRKFRIKLFKWSAFLAVTLVITHSFLAYFVGTESLFHMIRSNPAENPTAFIFMLAATAIILLDFGWFREQFCIIVCPYGRLQSVLMDDHSQVVAYDTKRGEPRRGTLDATGAPLASHGDCVNCFRCVQVCPTGIDIRRGVQMECIACTACVDACDEVMTKIKKPVGLIRYDTERGLRGEKPQPVRTRTFVYLAILFVITSGFTYVLLNRESLDVVFIRAIDTPYQILTEPSASDPSQTETVILNHFKISVSNKTFHNSHVQFSTKDPNVKIVMQLNPIDAPAGKTIRADIFVKIPKSKLENGHADTKLLVQDDLTQSEHYEKEHDLHVVGPLN